jgi:hypothetical protein
MAVAARDTVHELPIQRRVERLVQASPSRKRARVIQFPFPSPLLHPDAAEALLVAFRAPVEER